MHIIVLVFPVLSNAKELIAHAAAFATGSLTGMNAHTKGLDWKDSSKMEDSFGRDAVLWVSKRCFASILECMLVPRSLLVFIGATLPVNLPFAIMLFISYLFDSG